MTTDELEPPAFDLHELLVAERALAPIEREVSERLAARLERTLGLPPVVTGSGLSAGASAAGGVGWTAGRITQLAVAFAVGGVTGTLLTIGVLGLRGETMRTRGADQAQSPIHDAHMASAPPREPATAPIPRADEPRDAKGVPPPSQLPVAQAGKARAPDAGTRLGNDLGDHDLGAERHLLELAHAALARGHAEEALAALVRHARRFPRGRLSEERESLRVPCLVVLGRSDEAKTTASQFLSRYPDSLFAPGVRRAVASIP